MKRLIDLKKRLKNYDKNIRKICCRFSPAIQTMCQECFEDGMKYAEQNAPSKAVWMNRAIEWIKQKWDDEYTHPIIMKSVIEEFRSFMDEPSKSIWHDAAKEQPETMSTVITYNGKNVEVLRNVLQVNVGYKWCYLNDIVKMIS